MKDEVVFPAHPLVGLNGSQPAGPAWFAEAVKAPFENFSVEVAGARIDCRALGERGRPGLVFLHGNGAHLGWWDFLAPMFAADYRVVLLSFAGMGKSDWRQGYSIDLFATEGVAASQAGGADLAGPPVYIGHSLGGLPVIRIAARMSEHIRAGIVVDAGVPGAEVRAIPVAPESRVYPELRFALDRFRLSPAQPCENLYIADYLARGALFHAVL